MALENQHFSAVYAGWKKPASGRLKSQAEHIVGDD